MRYTVSDERFRFKYAFDTASGAYVRTGILDDGGRDTGVDPFMGSFPHLIDVGIMGHCIHGKMGLCAKAGVGCYQSGPRVEEPNMSLDDFAWIAGQCSGRTNQFALGGRGDPDQHEQFGDILRVCNDANIVPNFTTSGYGMTPEIAELCREYCGAVAVSWYRSEYTQAAIRLLLDAGVTTNIHYVLGNNSIDEAIRRLERDDFPQGINAVIFLLHKPVGLGSEDNVLRMDNPRVRRFFAQYDRIHPFKIGLDSCSVPGVLNHCANVIPESLDTCEAGRFSCYIASDLTMMPCSFDQTQRYGVSLRGSTIEKVWNSETFGRFRDRLQTACPACERRALCMGGCPLMPQIVLCGSKDGDEACVVGV